ncbi:MAG: hypothetical protein AAF518_21280 [Spirochaetota bacterium]
MKGFTIKDNVQKLVGGVLLALGVLVLFLGTAMFFDTSAEESQNASGKAIAIFSFAILLPGGLLMYYGIKNARFEENVIAAASIVKSARRITLIDLAQKLNCSVVTASNVLSKAISLGLVNGNFDRSTDEFFTEEGDVQRLQIKFCSACGAPLDKTYMQGETIKCQSCGAIL